MLSPHTTRQVLALSGVALNTLRAFERDPAAVREISRLRIENALRQLGLARTAQPLAQPLMQASGAAVGSVLDIGAGDSR